MSRIAVVIFIIFFSTTSLFAKEKNLVNTPQIQQYKGKIGVWLRIRKLGNVYYFSRKFNTSYKEVKKLNGNSLKVNSYIFFPYSQKYIDTLAKKGKKIEYCYSNNEDFIWPLGRKEKISSFYGMRLGILHTGIDLPARRGYPIVAARDGKVLTAVYSSGYGKVVSLEHRNGFLTRYAHMSEMLVNKGDFVKKGQIIGFVGSTGNSTGNHLHFEIVFQNIPLNPIDFLPARKEFKNKTR